VSVVAGHAGPSPRPRRGPAWCPARAAWARLRSGGLRCLAWGLAVHAAAAGLLIAGVADTALDGLRAPGTALAFAGFVAIGELARTPLPGERDQAPLGAAWALAYALLGPDHGVPVRCGMLQVVAVTGIGGLLGILPQAALGRRLDVDLFARRLLTIGFTAVLFQPPYCSGALDRLGVTGGPLYALYLAGCAALGALFDVLLAAVLRYCREAAAGRPAAGLGRLLRDELAALLGIGTAVVATGVVMAVAVGEAGLWALPLFAVPLLFTQVAFRRYAAARATQRQTISSLARATEVAGYTLPGHSQRVASLARRTGRELGLGERELLVLEYAALMHDIGQLSLVDPIPGGATVFLPPQEQRRIARLGSEVIRKTGVPPEVAEIVARQADPYRPVPARRSPARPPAAGAGAADPSATAEPGAARAGHAADAGHAAGAEDATDPGAAGEAPPPLAARIIRVANAYADLAAEQGAAAPGSPYGAPGPAGPAGMAGRLEAIERLRRDSAQEFEPRVVEALARVCTRS